MEDKYTDLLRKLELGQTTADTQIIVTAGKVRQDVIFPDLDKSIPDERKLRAIHIGHRILLTTMFYQFLGIYIDEEKENEEKTKERYLFYDTETVGLPKDYKAPVTNTENWPRMVQIAWIVTDGNGELLKKEMHIIKPDGFIIPPEVAKLHRVTHERAEKLGKPLKEVMEMFSEDVINSHTIVAHNINFDKKITGAEFVRLKMQDPLLSKKLVCTMMSTVDFCKLPGKFGFKWPQLAELYLKLFEEVFEDAHDALVDVEAMIRCFWELKERAIII